MDLFNGRDLDGWEHVGPGGFDVRDGCLTTVGGMGLLWHTRATIGDATLRVVWRATSKRDNSGVFVRIDGPPPDPSHAVHHGYEIQILDDADDTHATGCVYSMSRVLARPSGEPGAWNEMDVELDGRLIVVRVNGVVVTRFDPDGDVPPRERSFEPERGSRPLRGYVGLQNHDEASVVQFREVRVL